MPGQQDGRALVKEEVDEQDIAEARAKEPVANGPITARFAATDENGSFIHAVTALMGEA